jgi:hypothetical protein
MKENSGDFYGHRIRVFLKQTSITVDLFTNGLKKTACRHNERQTKCYFPDKPFSFRLHFLPFDSK